MTDAASSNLRPSREIPGSLDASALVGRLLEQTTMVFEAIRMSLARRWAETLLAAVLNVPHEELTAHAGRTLNPEQRRRFEGIVRQASPNVPLAYAIGRAPFMNLDFEVSPDTLIPKVDTELFVGTMLDELARSPLPSEPHVLELCTGSGCLAVFLANRLPEARVVATDVSREALAVAGRNVLRHDVGARVALGLGDMWEPVVALAAGRPFEPIRTNPAVHPDGENLRDGISRLGARAAPGARRRCGWPGSAPAHPRCRGRLFSARRSPLPRARVVPRGRRSRRGQAAPVPLRRRAHPARRERQRPGPARPPRVESAVVG